MIRPKKREKRKRRENCKFQNSTEMKKMKKLVKNDQ